MVLILTDSRGHSLGRQLPDIDLTNFNINVHVRPYSGGKVADIARKGLRDYGYHVYDRIYLLGGVNNLTSLVGNFVEPRFYNCDAMVRELMIELYTARTQLDPIAREVVVCDLIGLSLRNYNYGLDSHAFPIQQLILNCAVLKINEYVQEMNEERGLHSPQLADVVHKKRGCDKIEHRYSSTLHDGLHFNTNTAIKILDKLILNILS